jgi:hypothetical protein
MLMPPAQPQSPNSDYDFILKDKQTAKRNLPLPNLPKPMLIAVAVLAGLILVIIVASLLSGRKNSQWQPFESVLARGQETLRVTQLTQQELQLQDPQTKALAATVSSALTSDQQQIKSYLTKNHFKVSQARLAAETDKSTDADLQTASQNNSLDSAYVSYLKSALNKYQADLQTASNGAGPNGKQILSDSIESTRALLNSAPIK